MAIPTYTIERDIDDTRQRDLMSLAYEWFDNGIGKAMYQFAGGRPCDGRKLLAEAKTTLRVAQATNHRDVPRLVELVDYAAAQVAYARLRIKTRVLLIEAAKAGVDKHEVKAWMEEAYADQPRA
ncbi:hypothetical protein HOU02_gp370 [Caulobacter phage CcrBL9]|uniref:Uncharacterized protein n=1 Tax=Caulobacter phage CcrBL9 TaxID=2283270 RepID=A0A385EEB0_9CAUD|nr:hypothetical protein HOU02_gp370 [Caulobacter phage CcrBL9]AXQ69355.1 hypothetical protein CcrBL9_gp331 [Caulobacter phage CcrBL9]